MESADLEALYQSAAAPDRAEFGLLLEQALPALRAFVRLKAGPGVLARESVSDLVQSVCHDLLRHRERFAHGGVAGFRRWMYVQALRKIQDRYRREFAARRDLAREEHESAWEEACVATGTPSQQAIGREASARLEQAFAKLGDEEQNVILWSRMCGMSHSEIAAAIGKSEVATRKVLSRALARLAELVEE